MKPIKLKGKKTPGAMELYAQQPAVKAALAEDLDAKGAEGGMRGLIGKRSSVLKERYEGLDEEERKVFVNKVKELKAMPTSFEPEIPLSDA